MDLTSFIHHGGCDNSEISPDYPHLCFWNTDSGRITADNYEISRVRKRADNHIIFSPFTQLSLDSIIGAPSPFVSLLSSAGPRLKAGASNSHPSSVKAVQSVLASQVCRHLLPRCRRTPNAQRQRHQHGVAVLRELECRARGKHVDARPHHRASGQGGISKGKALFLSWCRTRGSGK